MSPFKFETWENKKTSKSQPQKNTEEYIPPKRLNSHLGRTSKVEEFEDAYTIATRGERTLKESGADINNEVFIDKTGRIIPLRDLNGESNILAERDERAVVKAEELDKMLASEDENELDNASTSVALKVELKNKISNSRITEDSSIDRFHNQINQARKRKKNYLDKSNLPGHQKKLPQPIQPGLYKSYNPKLNAGAPGNRLERRRKNQKEHEEFNWQQ